MYIYIYTNRQKYRQAGRQIDRQTDRQTDREGWIIRQLRKQSSRCHSE